MVQRMTLLLVLASWCMAPPLMMSATAEERHAPTFSLSGDQPTQISADEKVYFNKSSRKYHCPTCTWAKRCTDNCITITKAEAISRGGVACKVCGGTCQ